MTNTSNLAVNAFNQDSNQTHDLEHDLPRIGIANHHLHSTTGHAYSSATSWSAIFAGAAAAAALALILLLLGTGLGLSFVSPWSFSSGLSSGASSAMAIGGFGVSAILWVTMSQIVAYGMGGYLAGRLRTRWVDTPADEVYFRDTAHGFLTWAVASLATAVLLTSVIGSIIGNGLQAGAATAGELKNLNAANSSFVNSTFSLASIAAVASGKEADAGSMTYFVNTLFRKKMDAAAAAGPDVITNLSTDATAQVVATAEIASIFANTIRRGELPAADIQYVGQLIAERTGLSQLEAEKRVIDTYSTVQTKLHDAEALAKDAANTARKASAYVALWLFISLLIGAFVASWAATYGGRCRDN